MKTKNLFKSIVTVALGTVISMGAFAQAKTTAHAATVDNTVGNELTDYVTVGAEVPYQIQSSLPIWNLIAQGVLVPSVYNWSIAAGPTIYKSDGTTAATTASGVLGTETFPAAGAGFYIDTLIYIKFPATGAKTLTVHERSVSNVAGIAGCLDGVGWSQAIQVTNRPAVIFNSVAKIGGCGTDVAVNNDIPITVSGSNNPIVTYSIDYTNLAGTVTHPVVNATVNDAGFVAPTGWTAFSVDNLVTNVAIPFNITDGNYGTYVVTLSAITDRISRKSLDIAVGGVSQDLGDVVLSGPATLTIYAYPTPVTGKIKHVTNLTW
jgi:hypothetical protein